MSPKPLIVLAVLGSLAAFLLAGPASSASRTHTHQARHHSSTCGDPAHPSLVFSGHKAAFPFFPLDAFGRMNVNFDIYAGKLARVSGNQVTLNVSHTLCSDHASVDTIDLPANTQVRIDGVPSSLSQLALGDNVFVVLSDHGNYVIAKTAH